MTTKSRAETCEATFDAALKLAVEHGMMLTNPSMGVYQLRGSSGWIINLYPRHSGCSPRIYHDLHHKGPFLNVPQMWTLLDVVKAAVEVK